MIPSEPVIPSNMKSRTDINLLGNEGRLNGIKLITPANKLNNASIITTTRLL